MFAGLGVGVCVETLGVIAQHAQYQSTAEQFQERATGGKIAFKPDRSAGDGQPKHLNL
jgi:hypothetical protein